VKLENTKKQITNSKDSTSQIAKKWEQKKKGQFLTAELQTFNIEKRKVT